MYTQHYTLGFSPCPNDTFMFYALYNKKIDLQGLSFDFIIEDVENLNRLTKENIPDISKISFHVFAYLHEHYRILHSGSALGYKNGPLVVSRKKIYPDELAHCTIGIPGRYTTANLLFSILFPLAQNKKEYLFSDIEEAILENECDAGLIIHEKRFTYQNKGLHCIADLGEAWEKKQQLPVALGGIIIKNTIPLSMQQTINTLIRKSILYAFQNPAETRPFIKQYSQEKRDEVIDQHIELYVNDFSIDLGSKGKEAIEKLLQEGFQNNIIPGTGKNIFIS